MKEGRDSGERLQWTLKLLCVALTLELAFLLTSCVSRQAISVTSLTLDSSGVCDSQFSGIQKEQCLWLGAGDSIGLQWDVDVCASINGNPVTFTKLGPDQANGCDPAGVIKND